MNFPSKLLSIFGKHDGVQTPEDGVLAIPNALLPVQEIPAPVQNFYTGDQTGVVANASFTWSLFQIRTNLAGTGFVLRFAPGLWEFELVARYVTSYTDLVAVVGGFVGTFTLTGPDFLVFQFKPVLNVPQFVHWHTKLSIPIETQFTFTVDTNGVGETDVIQWALNGNRLG